MFFKKRKNVKHAWEKCEKLAHHGVGVVAWLGAIWHSKSAKRHSSYATWHAAPSLYIHAISCSRKFF